jgi:hypothetical protein
MELEFLIHCGSCWAIISESEFNTLLEMFPEMVCRIDRDGIDVTQEYLSTRRTKLIYG